MCSFDITLCLWLFINSLNETIHYRPMFLEKKERKKEIYAYTRINLGINGYTEEKKT